MHDAVREALQRLNGTVRSAVSLITGYTTEELDDLGGVTEEDAS